MEEYRIDAELNDVLPALSDEDHKALEESLLADGFKGAPIMVWGDIIVDGHNRYEICKKHDIPFETKEVEFESKEEAMCWMIRQQIGRRNLMPLQRIDVVEKYRPLYRKLAQENQSKAGKNYGAGKEKLLQNSSKAISTAEKMDVRAKLANDANVSTDTYSKGVKILKSGNEELIEQTMNGAKSINKAYKELKESQKEKPSAQNTDTILNDEYGNMEIDSAKLRQIQKGYQDYLLVFQQDVEWLSTMEFYQADEDVTGKVHSNLKNCFEKFKGMSEMISGMSLDEFGSITISK